MKLRTKKREIRITERIGEEEATFVINPLTPKESASLLEAATVREWERNQRFEQVDFYLFKIMKIDKVIKSWGDDIEDEEGNPLLCTRENKELVYAYNPELIDRIMEKADSISRKAIEEKEVIEKNL